MKKIRYYTTPGFVNFGGKILSLDNCVERDAISSQEETQLDLFQTSRSPELMHIVAAIHRQSREASPEKLHRTMLSLLKTRGVLALFLPALVPRLVHPAVTSAPLMWMMEKLQVIKR